MENVDCFRFSLVTFSSCSSLWFIKLWYFVKVLKNISSGNSFFRFNFLSKKQEKAKKIQLENIIYYKNNNIFMTDECNLEHIQMHFMIQFLHLILTNNQMHYIARTIKLLNSSFFVVTPDNLKSWIYYFDTFYDIISVGKIVKENLLD